MDTAATLVGPESGRVVVLSNALGTTRELWQSQLPALAADFRVLLYDHPPRSSVDALARDFLGLADDLGLTRFSWCGLSLGGMIGMWLGANEPNRVEKLVLACTAARFGKPQDWEQRAALVRREGMSVVAADALAKWFTPAFRERAPFLRMQLETPPEEYALGLEAIGAFDFRDSLGRIDAPTLVIAGAEDSATTPADAVLIAHGIAKARLVVLDGAAHLANVEQATAFNAALMEHLRSDA